MNAPNPPHWTLNSCFGVLHSVWVNLGSLQNCMKLGAKQCELVQLMQKYVPQNHVGVFFSTNTPNPLHWTLNSCFGAFHSVCVYLGSFRYSMKLDAKQGELVQLIQKFLKRSRVGIFLYERTQSTPLDPKLMFWCVAKCLIAFGIVS